MFFAEDLGLEDDDDIRIIAVGDADFLDVREVFQAAFQEIGKALERVGIRLTGDGEGHHGLILKIEHLHFRGLGIFGNIRDAIDRALHIFFGLLRISARNKLDAQSGYIFLGGR